METTIPFKASGSRWWRLILSGVLFEIALVVIVCLLPETWLASEIRNATIVVHLPLLIVLASAPDVLGLVLLPFALFAMGLFWALVFYWILRLKTRLTEPEFDSEHVIPLSDVEGNLTSQTLRSWLAELDQCNAYKAIVSIPRFKTGQDFDLSGCLKALGMASAFDKDKANFSGMDETTNLYVSDVFHRAFVEVNESGTEAAAASLVFVKTRSMPERFIANHPFIFLIRDNATGSILFLGRIVDPTE